ncbi:hypothetical protein [uncultured Tenacibaculum sp.]|uniref:hypothetical protein n=1 Tax=uncultured Tenacibaculum sp. TaxID=174713 RepID=UPI00263830B9|nr:hypothetical protein [uncultured Tenacibaculum sp.]
MKFNSNKSDILKRRILRTTIIVLLQVIVLILPFFMSSYFVYSTILKTDNFSLIFFLAIAISNIILSIIFISKLYNILLRMNRGNEKVIQNLNSLLINHPTKYINPEKHKEYLADTVNKIYDTIYTKL